MTIMIICKNFPKLLFSLFLVTLSIHGVTPSIHGVTPHRCLWEILYDIGQLLINTTPELTTVIDTDHFLNIWDETEICYPDDVRDQHQKNFGPAPRVLRYADDSKEKTQVTNRVAISTKIKDPQVVDISTHTPGVTVKHRTNITMKTTEPRQANNEGITYNYYSRLSSETTVLICFLATVVAIALYLSFSLYREKKQNRNASNKDSFQSIGSASSGDAEDSEHELNEILLDDISNLTSTMMVRTYLESLAKELKNSHTKENISKYITDEFLTMVSERIARDAYMRLNFMESITAESLLKLAHLYHLTGMRQQRDVSSILGIQQEKNINVILKVGKGFEFKTKTELKEVTPEDGSTQTDFKVDYIQDGSTQTDVKKGSLDAGVIANQANVKRQSLKDGVIATQTDARKASLKDGVIGTQTDVRKASLKDGVIATQTDVRKASLKDGVIGTQTDVRKASIKDGIIATQTDAKDESSSSTSSSSSSSDPKKPTVDSKGKRHSSKGVFAETQT